MPAVLLVEDDKQVSGPLKCYLENVGFTVFSAASVYEAICWLDAEAIDCVVSDYYIDGGTVRNVMRALQSRAICAPVVVISGVDRVVDPHAGVTAWIQKPFDLAVVERLLRRACAASA